MPWKPGGKAEGTIFCSKLYEMSLNYLLLLINMKSI